jgi:hypothetical protein
MLLALIRFAQHWVGLEYFVSHGADLVRSGGEDGVGDAGGGCVGAGRRRRRRAATAASSVAGRVGTPGWDPSPLRAKTLGSFFLWLGSLCLVTFTVLAAPITAANFNSGKVRQNLPS